ncbi:MAG TPA: histidine phosphatase family protein [Euzebyales bacterium]|nr:histidine phosphatase family protein [Euzebyales bacterium]
MNHGTRPAIHFVRHGESVANVADRARRDRPDDSDRLSDRGWAQARELGRRLRDKGLEAIVASPMRRAQETAAGIAETLDLPLSTDPDLFEVRQCDAFYAARPDQQHRYATLAWMPAADPTYAEPGAESFADVVARVHRVQQRLHGDADHGRVVAVSHFGFLHWFLGVTLFGEDFVPAHLPALYRMGHANTGITVFERHDRRVMDGLDLSGWVLTTWNDQAHL